MYQLKQGAPVMRATLPTSFRRCSSRLLPTPVSTVSASGLDVCLLAQQRQADKPSFTSSAAEDLRAGSCTRVQASSLCNKHAGTTAGKLMCGTE